MGVIKRQSFKYSLINFAGTLIGGISVLFIYSLDDELYGFAQMLISTAVLLVPLAGFGIAGVAVRFFREFKNGSDNNGFLSLLLAITLVTNVIFLVAYYLFRDSFYDFLVFLNMNADLVRENESVILCLVLLFNVLGLLIAFISNYRRIVVPTLVNTLGYKIFFAIAFLLVLGGYLSAKSFSVLIPVFYCTSLLILAIYLIKIGGGHLTWKPDVYKKKRKPIRSYLLYTGFTSLGSSLTYRLDSVMVALILGLQPNGLFNKVSFMANVIAIPTTSVNQIANPIISEAIEKKDFDQIEYIYKESSANLFLLGSYLYVLMIFCLPQVFQLSANPSSFEGSMGIFLFLGGAKLIDMLTSVNGAIIGYSKFYKYNLLFILLLGVSNVLLNYFFINEIGVTGAALASFIALFMFNLLKGLLVYIKFGIHPFSQSTYKVMLLMVVAFVALFFLQINAHPIPYILIYTAVATVIFILGVKYLNVSKDATSLLDQVGARLTSIFTRKS